MRDKLAYFAENIPNMHTRHTPSGEPYMVDGGFGEKVMLDWMASLFDRLIDKAEDQKIIETGAGVTSLFFLLYGFGQVTSVAPCVTLYRMLQKNAIRFDVPMENFDYRLGYSEKELPELAKFITPKNGYSCAFIDGDHGWPAVFVDFCYINMMLKKGGLLIIDDLQIYSVRELYNLLKEHHGWEVLSVYGKSAVFRKLSGDPYLHGAGVKYIADRDKELPRLKNFDLIEPVSD